MAENQLLLQMAARLLQPINGPKVSKRETVSAKTFSGWDLSSDFEFEVDEEQKITCQWSACNVLKHHFQI